MADQGDLPRALRFAVSQIQSGAGPTEPMNEQDRNWLNEVLGEMAHNKGPHNGHSGKDDSNAVRAQQSGITGVLRNLVDLIQDGKKSHLVDAVKNELQHIAEDGELLDRADDCDRQNAVASISALLALAVPPSEQALSVDPVLHDMIAPICSILAELAQNSPACQEEALKLIPSLIRVISSDGKTCAKTKAVYALSGILRGNLSSRVASYLLPGLDQNSGNQEGDENRPEGEQRGKGAIEVLVQLVLDSTEAVPTRIKAAFLLSCLAEHRHDVRQALCSFYETDLQKLQHLDADLKELVDGILSRIRTVRSESGKTPLALAM